MASIKASKPLEEIGQSSPSIYLEVGDKRNIDRKIKMAFLEDAKIGYEIFAENNSTDPEDKRKAIVYRAFDKDDIPKDITPFDGGYGPSKIKEILVAKVWDYEAKEVKLFITKQANVINQFLAVDMDDDLNDINSYNWKITWNAETGLDRKYEVLRLTDFQVTDEINEAYVNSKIDVDAFLRGENPIPDDGKEIGTINEEKDPDTDF